MRQTRTILATAVLGLALISATLPDGASATTATPFPGQVFRTSMPATASTARATPAALTASRPRKKRHHRTKAIMPIRRRDGFTHGAMTAPMTYHGGYLMTDPAHVYLIWYGTWSGAAAVPILTDLIRGLGYSRYAATNSTFTDSSGHRVTTDITYAGAATVIAKHGARLSDAGVRAVVRRVVTSGRLPSDTDGIYIVLTSADVRETSGFGSRYCGWHTRATIGGADLKYAFVGDPSTQAPRGCASPLAGVTTPNGDAGADAMASTLVHEIDETLTDPQLHGWYDRYFNENADKCAWSYGLTYPAANGASANLHLGGRDFLVQRNWIVDQDQGCAMSA